MTTMPVHIKKPVFTLGESKRRKLELMNLKIQKCNIILLFWRFVIAHNFQTHITSTFVLVMKLVEHARILLFEKKKSFKKNEIVYGYTGSICHQVKCDKKRV